MDQRVNFSGRYGREYHTIENGPLVGVIPDLNIHSLIYNIRGWVRDEKMSACRFLKPSAKYFAELENAATLYVY